MKTFQYILTIEFNVENETLANELAHEIRRGITNHEPIKGCCAIAQETLARLSDDGNIIMENLWTR